MYLILFMFDFHCTTCASNNDEVATKQTKKLSYILTNIWLAKKQHKIMLLNMIFTDLILNSTLYVQITMRLEEAERKLEHIIKPDLVGSNSNLLENIKLDVWAHMRTYLKERLMLEKYVDSIVQDKFVSQNEVKQDEVKQDEVKQDEVKQDEVKKSKVKQSETNNQNQYKPRARDNCSIHKNYDRGGFSNEIDIKRHNLIKFINSEHEQKTYITKNRKEIDSYDYEIGFAIFLNVLLDTDQSLCLICLLNLFVIYYSNPDNNNTSFKQIKHVKDIMQTSEYTICYYDHYEEQYLTTLVSNIFAQADETKSKSEYVEVEYDQLILYFNPIFCQAQSNVCNSFDLELQMTKSKDIYEKLFYYKTDLLRENTKNIQIIKVQDVDEKINNLMTSTVICDYFDSNYFNYDVLEYLYKNLKEVPNEVSSPDYKANKEEPFEEENIETISKPPKTEISTNANQKNGNIVKMDNHTTKGDLEVAGNDAKTALGEELTTTNETTITVDLVKERTDKLNEQNTITARRIIQAKLDASTFSKKYVVYSLFNITDPNFFDDAGFIRLVSYLIINYNEKNLLEDLCRFLAVPKDKKDFKYLEFYQFAYAIASHMIYYFMFMMTDTNILNLNKVLTLMGEYPLETFPNDIYEDKKFIYIQSSDDICDLQDKSSGEPLFEKPLKEDENLISEEQKKDPMLQEFQQSEDIKIENLISEEQKKDPMLQELQQSEDEKNKNEQAKKNEEIINNLLKFGKKLQLNYTILKKQDSDENNNDEALKAEIKQEVGDTQGNDIKKNKQNKKITTATGKNRKNGAADKNVKGPKKNDNDINKIPPVRKFRTAEDELRFLYDEMKKKGDSYKKFITTNKAKIKNAFFIIFEFLITKIFVQQNLKDELNDFIIKCSMLQTIKRSELHDYGYFHYSEIDHDFDANKFLSQIKSEVGRNRCEECHAFYWFDFNLYFFYKCWNLTKKTFSEFTEINAKINDKNLYKPNLEFNCNLTGTFNGICKKLTLNDVSFYKIEYIETLCGIANCLPIPFIVHLKKFLKQTTDKFKKNVILINDFIISEHVRLEKTKKPENSKELDKKHKLEEEKAIKKHRDYMIELRLLAQADKFAPKKEHDKKRLTYVK